jgi:hypothetical protein
MEQQVEAKAKYVHPTIKVVVVANGMETAGGGQSADEFDNFLAHLLGERPFEIAGLTSSNGRDLGGRRINATKEVSIRYYEEPGKQVTMDIDKWFDEASSNRVTRRYTVFFVEMEPSEEPGNRIVDVFKMTEVYPLGTYGIESSKPKADDCPRDDGAEVWLSLGWNTITRGQAVMDEYVKDHPVIHGSLAFKKSQ